MTLGDDLKLIGEAIAKLDLSKHGEYFSFTVNSGQKGLKYNFYTPVLGHHFFFSSDACVKFIESAACEMPRDYRIKQLMGLIEEEKKRLGNAQHDLGYYKAELEKLERERGDNDDLA